MGTAKTGVDSPSVCRSPTILSIHRGALTKPNSSGDSQTQLAALQIPIKQSLSHQTATSYKMTISSSVVAEKDESNWTPGISIKKTARTTDIKAPPQTRLFNAKSFHALGHSISAIFLPAGYPSSVTPGILQFFVGFAGFQRRARRIVIAGNEAHLFAWKHAKGLRLPSKKEFIESIAIAAQAAGLRDLKGHSLRISGTLECSLRGVPFDIWEDGPEMLSRST
ncbi:hypothetical protein BDR03DRAFT_981040 [Suillus americanus]|nr:hypothetical protein BDR03DRAFT_981040 [Suillus americanus]